MSKLTVVGSINADLIVHAERHPARPCWAPAARF